MWLHGMAWLPLTVAISAPVAPTTVSSPCRVLATPFNHTFGDGIGCTGGGNRRAAWGGEEANQFGGTFGDQWPPRFAATSPTLPAFFTELYRPGDVPRYHSAPLNVARPSYILPCFESPQSL